MTQLAMLDEEKEDREIPASLGIKLRLGGRLRSELHSKVEKCWLDFAARKLTLNEKGSCQLPLQKNEF